MKQKLFLVLILSVFCTCAHAAAERSEALQRLTFNASTPQTLSFSYNAILTEARKNPDDLFLYYETFSIIEGAFAAQNKETLDAMKIGDGWISVMPKQISAKLKKLSGGLKSLRKSFLRQFNGMTLYQISETIKAKYPEQKASKEKFADFVTALDSPKPALNQDDDSNPLDVKLSAAKPDELKQTISVVCFMIVNLPPERAAYYRNLFYATAFEAYKKYPKRDEIGAKDYDDMREFDKFVLSRMDGKSMNELVEECKNYPLPDENDPLRKKFDSLFHIKMQ